MAGDADPVPTLIRGLDHLVLTVTDVQRTIDFYTTLLGMREVRFGSGRRALRFGGQKINLHESGREPEPKALRPVPGSADLCFRVNQPVVELADRLQAAGVPLLEGPVQRTGARGPLLSIYLRDPDGNLIELANELANELAGEGGDELANHGGDEPAGADGRS